MKQLNIALVGLGFGGAFAEIYRDHPLVGSISLYDTDTALTRQVSQAFHIPKTHESFEAILADPTIDAVHLVTPIPLHEEQSIAVLDAGKHCACTVPMAITLEGIQRITDATRRSGKTYMMMETTLYTYQFFYVQQMLQRGELGRIQFLRGAHYQDMAGWPDYWLGLPPMYYGTHAIGPLVALAGAPATRVTAYGSGSMAPDLVSRYGNPYPVETALIAFASGMKAEATRSLFETARVYQEGLFVYGSDASFEWGFADGDRPYVTRMQPPVPDKRGREAVVTQITLPNYHQTLPPEIQGYTVGSAFDPLNPQESLAVGTGGGHHGSHPHLVHEFVSAIHEGRKPLLDEVLGGNITATGILAHASAMADGKPMDIPSF